MKLGRRTRSKGEINLMIQPWCKENLFHHEVGQTVEYAAQGGCAISILRGFQDQLGPSSSSVVRSKSWPGSEQEVGLETSWGSIKPELSCDVKILFLSSKLFPHMLKAKNYEASFQCCNITRCQRNEFSYYLFKHAGQGSDEVGHAEAMLLARKTTNERKGNWRSHAVFFFFFFLSAIIHNLGAAKCIEKLCKQFRALHALLDKIRCWCYSVIG